MSDELEDIDGIKPNVWLADGEEREVGSQTRYASFTRNLFNVLTFESNSVYKVKHTWDHYYW